MTRGKWVALAVAACVGFLVTVSFGPDVWLLLWTKELDSTGYSPGQTGIEPEEHVSMPAYILRFVGSDRVRFIGRVQRWGEPGEFFAWECSPPGEGHFVVLHDESDTTILEGQFRNGEPTGRWTHTDLRGGKEYTDH